MKTRQALVAISLAGFMMAAALPAVMAQSSNSTSLPAMQPSSTLGPASKSAPAARQDEPRQARIPGMARFRSIGTEDAVMFDAPSDKAKRIYQAPRGMPVEVISVLQDWVKVRDFEGDVAWVHRDDLADRRTVIARERLSLRKEPSEMAGSWFEAAPGVIFDLQQDRADSEGFVRVRHTDGQVGFLDSAQLWGL
ncbi:MAG: SH3 domain-containing protein [Lautropia sp.]|nr:SH3 domain-containing protein [Lautropia sp.]